MTTLTTLAQYRMEYGDHMDSGWGWAMVALMAIALVAVVVLVVWLIRSAGTGHGPAARAQGGAPAETPMQILDRRLAAGEISPDDYRERAAILGGG